MPERLLLVPPWAFSPDALSLIPAGRSAQAALAEHFEIEIVRWPMLHGEPRTTDTWEAAVDSVQRALAPGTHVLSVGGSASSAIEAISRDGNRAASLVVEGLILPEATLLAAGFDSLAALVPLMLPVEKSWASAVARLIMAEAGEDQVDRFARRVIDDLDWEMTRTLSLSWAGWNMLANPPRLTVPTLFLAAALPIAGYDETLRVLRRFAPAVEVERLELWPTKNHLPEAGAELAEKVIAFVHSTKTART